MAKSATKAANDPEDMTEHEALTASFRLERPELEGAPINSRIWEGTYELPKADTGCSRVIVYALRREEAQELVCKHYPGVLFTLEQVGVVFDRPKGRRTACYIPRFAATFGEGC